MHLKHSGFTYIFCGPFNKNKERIRKLKKIGDSNYIYQNELDKTCFQNDMVYGDFKDLNRRTIADKELHDKAFNNTKNPKYDWFQRGLASEVYKFFDKILLLGQLKLKLYLIKNYQKNYTNQLLENLRKEKYTHVL